MSYKNERELQHELAAIDFNFQPGYSFAYSRREVPVGGCIPDLVSIQFSQEPKINYGSVKWSYKHSFIVWVLKNWEIYSLEELASISFESIDRLSAIVDDLKSTGAMQINSDNKFVLSNEIENLQATVVAAEAKLRNWKQALSQAKRYKEFANIVFVAMDASNIPQSEEILFEFMNEEVGLCVLSQGTLEWLVDPIVRHDKLGHEREYLIMSATAPSSQMLWSRRYSLNESNQD